MTAIENQQPDTKSEEDESPYSRILRTAREVLAEYFPEQAEAILDYRHEHWVRCFVGDVLHIQGLPLLLHHLSVEQQQTWLTRDDETHLFDGLPEAELKEHYGPRLLRMRHPIGDPFEDIDAL